tara:strand:- start:10856 stop:11266 length:411 start_codon:yes stop_codon:yes gene_type:complete
MDLLGICGGLKMTELKISNHVFDRMGIRLDSAEERQVIHAIRTKWNRLENNTLKDFAIIAMTLDGIRKTDTSDWESNGDGVVGIVRKGELLTVMLRRFNQPMTKEALRVDSVKWAIKAPIQYRKMGRRVKNWRRKQ